MPRDINAAGGPASGRLKFIEMAMERTDRAVLISDASRAACYINPAFTEMFGYSCQDIESTNPWELLAGPMTDARLHARAENGADGRSGWYDDLLLRTRAGEPIWVSAKIEPVFGADGKLEHVVAMLSDISQTKRLQMLQREVLEMLARNTPLDSLMHFVCTEVETMAPEVTCSIQQVTEDHSLHVLAAPSLPEDISRALSERQTGPHTGACGAAAWRGQPVVSKDIETDPLWEGCRDLVVPLGYKACWSTPLMLRDGRVAGTFAFYFTEKRGPGGWHQQIVDACVHLCAMAIERHEARARINKLAFYDSLTGLPNRTLMRQQIEQTLSADPDRQRKIAFVCLDADRFKDINDVYGQPVGDAVLEAISQKLLTLVSSADMTARLSGDAFVVVLDDCDQDAAARAAQKMIAQLLEPLKVSSISLPVSMTAGIALYPDDARDVDTLLEYCETAMYEAKANGRGSYNFFSPATNAANKDRLVLGTALREALAQGELSMVFQPQIDGVAGGLYGVEALARWTHPQHGAVRPDVFISIAEQIGVIDAVGTWALQTACGQLADWRARRLKVPTISVNISPAQFRNPGFCMLVAQCLEDHGLKPSDLTIEITEGLMLEKTAAVEDNIKALTGMGVKLSMDDFGTGQSSLSLIARLPVTELKIDRAFIDQLEGDASAQAVVTAVVRIGQSLNMTVVAEGLETDAQRRFLDALGCNVYQGYFYAKPMARNAFEDWLNTMVVAPPQARSA